jgi:hypothetical protein
VTGRSRECPRPGAPSRRAARHGKQRVIRHAARREAEPRKSTLASSRAPGDPDSSGASGVSCIGWAAELRVDCGRGKFDFNLKFRIPEVGRAQLPIHSREHAVPRRARPFNSAADPRRLKKGYPSRDAPVARGAVPHSVWTSHKSLWIHCEEVPIIVNSRCYNQASDTRCCRWRPTHHGAFSRFPVYVRN